MVWLAIVVCGGLYSITLIPGIREVFAIPATFTLGHVGLCIAMAAVAVVLMEITKLIIIAVQNVKETPQKRIDRLIDTFLSLSSLLS